MLSRLFLVLVLLTACPAASFAAGNEAVAAEIVKLFDSRAAETGSQSADKAIGEVRAYYATRAFKPVWVRDDGPKSKAKALFAELRSSAVHGLSPQSYHVDQIAALMNSQDPGDLAQLDMLLSGAVVEFGRDLRNGRIGPGKASAENAVTPVELDIAAYIEGAADAGNFRQYASGFINADTRYVRLIAKLSEFQRMGAAHMWPQIAPSPAPVEKDAGDARIPLIRKMLVLTGDLPANLIGAGDVLDDEFAAALVKFQARHALAATGVLDADTLGEMAIPAEQRSRQIQLNLERRRWQNRPLQADHLYINMAEPVARLVRGDSDSTFLGIENLNELRDVPTFFGSVETARAEAGKTVVEIRPDPQTTTGMPDKPVRIVLDAEATLKPGLQVFVTYITTWVSSDGQLHFGRDAFARDAALATLMKLD